MASCEVRRPVTRSGGRSFGLSYVRTGPRSDVPMLVVPEGPGLASVLPYRAFRADAARRGVDVVMVEHRGVGLSRFDDEGADLPPAALTVEQVVDDLAAVLDAARLMRAAVSEGVVAVDETGAAAQVVHEFAGPEALEHLLQLRLDGRGRRTWDRLASLGTREIATRTPFVLESDQVSTIAFAELGFAPRPDGRPLDVNLCFADAAGRYPPFAGEPYDLVTELPAFSWPTAVVSGDRDLRTPRRVADRVVDLAPDAVPLADTGHSALDTHRVAALFAGGAVRAGAHRRLAELAPRLSALPRRGPSRLLGAAIRSALQVERVLPAAPS